MRYLHTMLRVRNLDAALDFYCNKLGLKEVRRRVDEKNRYTLVFLAAPDDGELVGKGPDGRGAPPVELTYNWDSEDYGEARYFGHLAYEVDDIYALCDQADEGGRHHQPPAARRHDGVRALARPAFHRAPAEGRAAAAEGAVDLDAQYRALVRLRCPLSRPCLPARGKPLYISRTPRLLRAHLRPSSSGPGHRPFTAGTGVRVP